MYQNASKLFGYFFFPGYSYMFPTMLLLLLNYDVLFVSHICVYLVQTGLNHEFQNNEIWNMSRCKLP